ncbi:MAG TPA: 30S ribosomal protein S30e [Geobacterales bacterium]|nr:30S ribosomal protein S30e [Geobacterales bacterium]
MPSHGSLTKAGKVRMATPKIAPKPKKSPFPRKHVRSKYFKRVLYPKISAASNAASEEAAVA